MSILQLRNADVAVVILRGGTSSDFWSGLVTIFIAILGLAYNGLMLWLNGLIVSNILGAVFFLGVVGIGYSMAFRINQCIFDRAEGVAIFDELKRDGTSLDAQRIPLAQLQGVVIEHVVRKNLRGNRVVRDVWHISVKSEQSSRLVAIVSSKQDALNASAELAGFMSLPVLPSEDV